MAWLIIFRRSSPGAYPAARRIILPLSVQVSGSVAEVFLLLFKQVPVVVADDIIGFCAFHAAAEGFDMVESFVIFCEGGDFKGGKHSVKFHGDEDGVYHLPFCRTRMDALPMENKGGGGCVEVFVFQPACAAAVDGRLR